MKKIVKALKIINCDCKVWEKKGEMLIEGNFKGSKLLKINKILGRNCLDCGKEYAEYLPENLQEEINEMNNRLQFLIN